MVISMKYPLAIALLTVSGGVQAQVFTGNAVAMDGDSLNMGGIEVRLFGIDAPEYTQVCQRGGQAWRCGEDAKGVLASLVSGKSVECVQRDKDHYGRIVATCKAGSFDLADSLARSGMAVALSHFSQDYVGAADRAKAARLGVWGSEFQLPSEYRASDPAFRASQARAERAQNAAKAASTRQRPSGRVYYRGCHEVRAAGAAPLYRGQPGYRPEMDGDGDGVACEPYRRR